MKDSLKSRTQFSLNFFVCERDWDLSSILITVLIVLMTILNDESFLKTF